MTVKFVVDKNGTSNAIDIDDSVCNTDLANPQGKLIKDTNILQGLNTFKSANVSADSDMSRYPTKIPTRKAVQEYVVAATAGRSGGFLGNLSVSAINALTSHSNGDYVVTTDAGTITLGEIEVVAGDELAWTVNGIWSKKATDFVRPSDYATTELGGTIVSSESDGEIGVDEDTGIGSVNGWSGKVDNSATGFKNLRGNVQTELASADIANDDRLYPLDKSANTPKWLSFNSLWTWIASKISSNLGLTSSAYGGNSATATTATSATYATSAGSAGTATSATYATSAGNADTVDNYHVLVVESGGSIPTTSGYITLVKV